MAHPRMPAHPVIVDPDTGRTWPLIMGGSDDAPPAGDAGTAVVDPPAGEPPAEPPATEPPADADLTGDAAANAAKAARRERDAAKARADAAEAALQALRDASKTAEEKAIDDAREEGRKAALAHYAGQIAAARAETLATKTSDPALAITAMGDLSRFVSDDGSVDTDAMSAELDAIVDKHPALKKSATPSGGPNGGPRPPAGDSKPVGLQAGLAARFGRK
jgi:hypothetical protein